MRQMHQHHMLASMNSEFLNLRLCRTPVKTVGPKERHDDVKPVDSGCLVSHNGTSSQKVNVLIVNALILSLGRPFVNVYFPPFY